ncbi:MAG: adenosine kinase [Alphaproteobacteria bacterium]|jgi:sugar/nucleoside kinase (ribokinase family)|nr:adenosine kinase [Alphaproteobacteria bacterium]
MASSKYDVLGIGNAIVDVIAFTEDDFLLSHDLAKGSMRLIDEAQAEKLYQSMGPATIISGGSAANTVVGVASLGGSGSFIGKVRNDTLGQAFTHDIRAIGVHFETKPADKGLATARSFILVTPDGERTMNTFLGACLYLGPDDIDPATVEASEISYFEGYLWDPEDAKIAFRKAASIAHAAGRKVALTLSDSFCVDRYRDEFRALITDCTIDILLANEHELKSLYTTSDFDSAVDALRNEGPMAVVTRSAAGSVVVDRNGVQAIPAQPIDRLVDTTGAGDLFASGFLLGHARGFDHRDAARLGAIAAAEIIQHIGARPEARLRDLAAESGITIS